MVDDSESENGDWPIRPVIVVRPPTEEGSEIIVRGISEELRGANESEIFDERQLDADDNDSDEIPLADLRKRRKAKQKREEAPRSQALRQSPRPGPPQVSVTVTEPPIIVIPDDPEPMAPDTPAVPTATPRPRPVTTDRPTTTLAAWNEYMSHIGRAQAESHTIPARGSPRSRFRPLHWLQSDYRHTHHARSAASASLESRYQSTEQADGLPAPNSVLFSPQLRLPYDRWEDIPSSAAYQAPQSLRDLATIAQLPGRGPRTTRRVIHFHLHWLIP